MARVPSPPAILVRDLRKSYGEVEAVRGIDFEVAPGEVFGLLGPNGAGKTTTTEILEGYRSRTSGIVSVLGHDPEQRARELRARVGIVLQSSGMYRHIGVREAVAHFARLYPRPRDVDEVLALAGLTGKEDALARTLSGGQARRLDFALAAQALCDRVAIVKEGRIVAEGPPASLGASSSRYRVTWRDEHGELQAREVEDPTALLHQLTSAALARGAALQDLHVSRPSLEDVYLELTAEAAVEEAELHA
ncbi:MAG: ABC transporter ATP-binding protein [Solirubrobacterales bacterium]|nr:ABC transporter ATP-binding protein [Solirubrobacterales bacterium]